jgi:hypothetical protein
LTHCFTKHDGLVQVFGFLNDELRVLADGDTQSALLRQAFHEFRKESQTWLLSHGLVGWDSVFYFRQVDRLTEWESLAQSILSAPGRSGLSDRLGQFPFVGTQEDLTQG